MNAAAAVKELMEGRIVHDGAQYYQWRNSILYSGQDPKRLFQEGHYTRHSQPITPLHMFLRCKSYTVYCPTQDKSQPTIKAILKEMLDLISQIQKEGHASCNEWQSVNNMINQLEDK